MTSETKFRLALTVLLTALLWLFVRNLAAGELMTLKVTPRVCQPPCTIHLFIRVAPKSGEDVEVMWCDTENSDVCGSSLQHLDGHTVIDRTDLIKDLPLGAYLIGAKLYHNNQVVAYADRMVYVGVEPR